jgi:hypothetical protein
MKHKVRVVDGGGNVSHRKLTWVRSREREKSGSFVDGIFYFYPQPQACSLCTTETLASLPPREVSLSDRLAAVPMWPPSTDHDSHYTNPHGFLRYPQRSQQSVGPIFRALSQAGAGLD